MMNFGVKIKNLMTMISLIPVPLWTAFRIFPSYVVSVGRQKITGKQIQYFLDSAYSSIAATPVASYVDWVSRNADSKLFENYPTESKYKVIKEYSSKVDRMHLAISFLKATQHVDGDIAEFGVYKGHTAILINQVREKWQSEKKIYLFDSFEGLPNEIGADDDFYAGQFSDTSAERVKQVVGGGDQVQVVKGFFSQTLHTLPELRFSFTHIDCDLEAAALECLEYVYPRLSYGGVIVFDDYGFRACVGLRRIVDDFFANKGETVITLPTSQAVYIKLRKT
ncbi:MAG: TylF/MycF/NovP-related O-methyltransferase [Anaerolineales bacterium]